MENQNIRITLNVSEEQMDTINHLFNHYGWNYDEISRAVTYNNGPISSSAENSQDRMMWLVKLHLKMDHWMIMMIMDIKNITFGRVQMKKSAGFVHVGHVLHMNKTGISGGKTTMKHLVDGILP